MGRWTMVEREAYILSRRTECLQSGTSQSLAYWKLLSTLPSGDGCQSKMGCSRTARHRGRLLSSEIRWLINSQRPAFELGRVRSADGADGCRCGYRILGGELGSFRGHTGHLTSVVLDPSSTFSLSRLSAGLSHGGATPCALSPRSTMS